MNHTQIIYSILMVVGGLLSYTAQHTVYANQNAPALREKASIQGYVWLDADENGLQDEGESGVENIMIRLYDMENLSKGNTLTDNNGSFSFDELDSGDYRLEVIKRIGYDFTNSDQGDDAIDSDIDPTTGETTSSVAESSGESSIIGVGFIERPLDPTPIELTEFEVGLDEEGGGVAIWWVTGAEIDTRGFRIWRSTTPYRDDAVEITGGLILSQPPDSNNSRQYLYIDENIINSKISYTYWLQEVEISNVTNDYGPEHMSGVIAVSNDVKPLVPIPDKRVYLPLILR